MSTKSPDTSSAFRTIADVLASLPGIPADRIRAVPSPGTATADDLLAAYDRDKTICELVDGTLVEKTVATYESALAFALAYFLHIYLDGKNLGLLTGPDGPLKILPNQIRSPDVAFINWNRLPGVLPSDRIFAVAPNLAVEIISPSNTKSELQRKLHDYFLSGVELVWYIDPAARTARIFTAEHASTEITLDGSLSGGDVLPGFVLPLAKLFARVERPTGQ